MSNRLTFFNHGKFFGPPKTDFYGKIIDHALQGFNDIAIIGALAHIQLVDFFYKKDIAPLLVDYNTYCWQDSPYAYLDIDPIFDRVYTFENHDLIIVMCGEHMYPMPKVHPGHYMILVNKRPDKYHRCPTNQHSDFGLSVEEIVEDDNNFLIIGDSLLCR
jgi:hypothetical protein